MGKLDFTFKEEFRGKGNDMNKNNISTVCSINSGGF